MFDAGFDFEGENSGHGDSTGPNYGPMSLCEELPLTNHDRMNRGMSSIPKLEVLPSFEI